MTITLASQFNFVPSMKARVEHVHMYDQVLKINHTLRAEEVTALRTALVRHTVDPLITRALVFAENELIKKAEKEGVEQTEEVVLDLLAFLVKLKTFEGSYEGTRFGVQAVGFRVDRIMNAAMSPLLSYHNEPQGVEWFLEAVELYLNTFIPKDSKLVIRVQPSLLEAPKKYKGSPSMKFVPVNRV
jgi:hypothetical protein